MDRAHSTERRFRRVVRATAGACAVAWWSMGPAHAAPSACATIEDATARLACYDQQNAGPQAAEQQAVHADALPPQRTPDPMPQSHAGASPQLEPALPSAVSTDRVDAAVQVNGTHTTVAAPAPSEQQPSNASEASRSSAAELAVDATPAAQAVGAETTTDGVDAFGVPRGSLFDDAATEAFDGERLESTIAAARRAPKQNTLFRLANDQIWIQAAPREVPIRPGDRVTILRGLIGGYVMRNDDGASTRVQRIK